MGKIRVSKIDRVKIFSRISRGDYNRLAEIRKKYGFKSNYQIIQYLVYCFLRVADPEHDEIEEPIPVEIEEMFDTLSEADKRFMFRKPKKRCPYKSPDRP